jgi:hypothetical protein
MRSITRAGHSQLIGNGINRGIVIFRNAVACDERIDDENLDAVVCAKSSAEVPTGTPTRSWNPANRGAEVRFQDLRITSADGPIAGAAVGRCGGWGGPIGAPTTSATFAAPAYAGGAAQRSSV